MYNFLLAVDRSKYFSDRFCENINYLLLYPVCIVKTHEIICWIMLDFQNWGL